MAIIDDLHSTYLSTLRQIQDHSPASTEVEQVVKRTKLADGRVAQITVRINTDREEWI